MATDKSYAGQKEPEFGKHWRMETSKTGIKRT